MAIARAQRDDGIAARLVPAVTTILAATLSVIPMRMPGFAVVTPAFALMAVYHWTIYRPELLNPLTVFAIGLYLDFLNGTPAGLSALTLLLSQVLVMGRRRWFVNRSFPFVWLGFAALSGLFMLMQWGVAGLFDMRMLDFQPFAFQGVLTVAIFPIASWVLVRAQRAFLRAS